MNELRILAACAVAVGMKQANGVSNIDKNMKKLYTIVLLAGMFVVPSVFAITITTEGGVGGYGPYQTGGGGEFTFKISDGSLISAYAATTMNQVSGSTKVPNFQTFCVETGEYIYPNTAYTATINNSGLTLYSGNYLTLGAAYLYSQFAQGALGSYNYGAGRTTTAGQLQHALWAFMGGEAVNQNNIFEKAAATALGGWSFVDDTAPVGYGGVYVLNLWDSAGKAAQDQLLFAGLPTPNNGVPDGGMTVMLLGMGLTGMGFFSRRLRR